MTQPSSAPAWIKPVAILAAVVAVLVLWSYLAGAIFLAVFDHPWSEARPWTFVQYIGGSHPRVVRVWLIIAGVAAAVPLLPVLLFFKPEVRSLHGAARFATSREIALAGLLGVRGILVGFKPGPFGLGGRYLAFDGQQHVMLAAPTRSGKGVGIVVPNLLNWPDSVVVLDIKQENWDLTSGFRARHGQTCYLFNPGATDGRTHRYNPLAYIRPEHGLRIDDTQKIGSMLFPDEGDKDIIWTATPRTLFIGIVLYLLETPEKPTTLGQVLRESLADGDGASYFAKIIKDRASTDRPLSAECILALNSYVTVAAEKTRAGIITAVRARLELWLNPILDAATSGNDFDLRELRQRRMSVYLGVTPDNLERMRPVLNLFFQQLIDLNTRELPAQNRKLRVPCLLLMDEFTAIGKINVLAKGVSFIAGYGLRLMPIIQSPSQLVEVYGKEGAKTLQVNHAMQIVFAPKAAETEEAKAISEWLGYQTVKGVSVSKSRNPFSKQRPTESTSDQRRALMLPQEIIEIGNERELLITEGLRPVLANKIRYFRDRTFLARLQELSPSLEKLGKRLPTKVQIEDAAAAGELAATVPVLTTHIANNSLCTIKQASIDCANDAQLNQQKEEKQPDKVAQSDDVGEDIFNGLKPTLFAPDDANSHESLVACADALFAKVVNM